MNSKVKSNLFLLIMIFGLETAKAQNVKFSCVNYYDPTAAQKVIDGENLSRVARYRGEWFQVAIPRFHGNILDFVYRETDSAEDIRSLIPFAEAGVRSLVQKKVAEYVKPFGLIVDHFHSVAEERGALLEARMKEFESLRDKIIDKAKEAAIEGKPFEFSKIDDLNGIRLVSNFRSDLMLPLRKGFEMSRDEMKVYYARILNLPVESIERVDIKGDANEMLKGKFYRAIHLSISMHGVPAEVQIMSDSMATWHHWDHPTVYKTKITDVSYNQALKIYSQFWAKLIRNVEDFDGTHFAADQIRTQITAYGLGGLLKEYTHSISFEWLQKIDRAYAAHYGIRPEDRFLGSKSVIDLGDQVKMFRSLAQPTFL